MNDPKTVKPGFHPGAPPAPGKPAAPAVRPAAPGSSATRPAAAASSRPAPAFNPTRPVSSSPGRPALPGKPSVATPEARPSGKVRHDERGNAVWEFIAQTSRIFVGATSRLLKKLDAPELKVEDKQDEELRIMPDTPKTGGGYDPYNQATKPKPGRK
jgi:hypothetical protein